MDIPHFLTVFSLKSNIKNPLPHHHIIKKEPTRTYMRHGIDGKAQDQEDKPSIGIETYDEVNKDSLHVISSLGEVKLIIN